jgi:hypothetical protein
VGTNLEKVDYQQLYTCTFQRFLWGGRAISYQVFLLVKFEFVNPNAKQIVVV